MDDEHALLDEPDTQPPTNAAAEAFTRLAARVEGMEERLDRRMAMMTRALEHIAIEKQGIEIPDYDPTLTRMNGHLADMGKRIKAVESAPALQMTPESMAERIGKAADTARKADDATFRQWDKLLDAKVRQVATIIGTADTMDEQKTMLLTVGLATGFAAFLLGIFLPVLILRALPESWHEPEAMATWVMGEQSAILARGDRSNLAEANLGDHPIEACASDSASRRTSEIIIYDFDARPAQRRQAVTHRILQGPAFAIVQNLMS